MKTAMKLSLTTLVLLSGAVVSQPAEASTESVNTLKTMKAESAAVKYNKAVTGGTIVNIDNDIKAEFNKNKLISLKKLNSEMLKLVNKDRKAKGLKSLKYAAAMQKGTETRVKELVNTQKFVHTRPNGTSPSTAFSGISGKYQFGENIQSRQYNNNPYTIVSEKYIAQELYKKWMSSTEHKGNMQRASYNSTAVTIKFTKPGSLMTNKMYAVQVFTNKKY